MVFCGWIPFKSGSIGYPKYFSDTLILEAEKEMAKYVFSNHCLSSLPLQAG